VGLVAISTNAGRVAGGANTVRIDAGVSLVGKVGVVRTGRVAAVSGAVTS
jgi:hypothetical protein